MKKVSFDFDDTLSLPSIQEYAKELILEGIEVHIVTSRYEDLTNYLPVIWPDGHNELFKVAKEIGIKTENIHFTNFEDKYKFFKDKDFIWHLDDDFPEIIMICSYTTTTGVIVSDPDFKKTCNELLKIYN